MIPSAEYAGLTRLRALVCSLLVLVGLAACRTQPKPYAAPMDSAPRSVEPYRPAPDWVARELSWEKLAEVEAWLSQAGYGSAEHGAGNRWRLEAELTLAEGRLELSRRERQEGLASYALERRLRLIEAGFQRVANHPQASPAQASRARLGLAGLASWGSSGSQEYAGDFVARARWGAKAARPDRMTRAGGGWRRITLHHSAEATPPELDGSLGASAHAVRRIQFAHMNSSGYGDIGYHFLIDPAGRVFQGRELEWQGAHASGKNNRDNLGVCLLGNFESQYPTPKALQALSELIERFGSQHAIGRSDLKAHLDFKNTLCPGRNLLSWLQDYRRGRGGPSASTAHAVSASQRSIQRRPASSAGGGTVR